MTTKEPIPVYSEYHFVDLRFSKMSCNGFTLFDHLLISYKVWKENIGHQAFFMFLQIADVGWRSHPELWEELQLMTR